MPRLWLFLILLLAGGCGDTQLVVRLWNPQGIYQIWIYVGDTLVTEKAQRCPSEACFFSLAPAVSSEQTINVLVEEIDKTQAGLVVKTRWQSQSRGSFYTYLEFAADKFVPSEPAPTTEPLNSVWGTGDDLWAVGANLTILHLNRTRWTTAQWTAESLKDYPADCNPNLMSVGGTQTGGVWAVGDHDTSLKRIGMGIWDFNDIKCGISREWKAIVGTGKQIFGGGRDGSGIEFIEQLFPTTPMPKRAILNGSMNETEVFRSMVSLGRSLEVLGYHTANGGNASLWEVEDPDSDSLVAKPKIMAPTGNLYALWASETSLFAGGTSNGFPVVQQRQADGTWRTLGSNKLSSSNLTVKGLWGQNDSDLWAVGQAGLLAHLDRSEWFPYPARGDSPPGYHAIWGDATGFWVVGDSGTLQHYYPAAFTGAAAR